MLDILCAIVDESDTLSDELFDIVFEALLEPHKSEAPAAAQLARGLVKLTATHIEDCVYTVLACPSPSAVYRRLFSIAHCPVCSFSTACWALASRRKAT